MAIDKESSGRPEVDLQRPTTKVNLGMIVAVVLFFVIMLGILLYHARNSPPEENAPSLRYKTVEKRRERHRHYNFEDRNA
jgi:hypothetical protein